MYNIESLIPSMRWDNMPTAIHFYNVQHLSGVAVQEYSLIPAFAQLFAKQMCIQPRLSNA